MELNNFLFSDRPDVLCVMNRVLDSFEMDTRVGVDIDTAEVEFKQNAVNCLIVDWSHRHKTAFLAEAAKKPNYSDVVRVALIETVSDLREASSMGVKFMLHSPGSVDVAMRAFRPVHGFLVQSLRKGLRWPVSVPVSLAIGERISLATVTDVSETGFGIKMEGPVKVDERVFASIKLPGINSTVQVSGSVTWAEEGRAGIRFAQLPQTTQSRLERWLRTQMASSAVQTKH